MIISLCAALIFTTLGPNVASYLSFFCDGEQGCLTEPLGTARPLQAFLLMNGICLYFVKVLYWNWFYSHSNTISVATVLLVCGGYYCFLAFSIIIPAYVVNRMPSNWEIGLAVILEPMTLLLEILTDWELFTFKATKKKGELLDYGFRSTCRHPK
jgi:hypothetical protein